ncbi:MAG: hypothetical protein MJ236_05250, partial [Clostridia bacterium]|nr:hypothetical protein [Clostridia bacterium]
RQTQSFEDYTEEISALLKKLHRNDYLPYSYYQEEIFTAYEKAIANNKGFYGVKTEYFQSVVDDVNSFVQSYNYDDSDSMTDYFDNNFYFFNVGIDNCQVVAKTARIKKHESKPATTEEPKTAALETSETDYTITESEHTKTHEKIYLVKWLPDLSRDEYITLNNAIKKIGGYYSKFTHSFIFKDDPTEQLKNLKLA